ncbi:MAG: NAD-dependent epimerase [Bacteroidetes bacterium MedPE-SWsnd-G2]|nr:MAG: NAD-dependent epimerase [Bacteroidetes bacterium MedPE-SWsnd-G2]
MILVTGGTGLVGSHLLYQLVNKNNKVKALYRSESTFKAVKHVFSYYTKNSEELFNAITWVKGDITDTSTLDEAFNDVTVVYHCAALVSFEPNKYHQLRQANINGTANIVNRCIAHGVNKICYVSSIAAIGHHQDPNKLIDESTYWNNEEDNSVYAITKYGAEIEVWRGYQEGLKVVIVNPGVIIGPGFWKYGSGNLIKKVDNGFKYFTHGTTAYVDVWDVVNPMIQLTESDVNGERFILVSENLSFKTFLDKTAKILNVPTATKEATSKLLNIGWRLDWLNHKITGKRRKLSKQLAKTAQTKTLYSSQKIIDTIGYEFKPMEESLNITANFYRDDIA